MLNPHLVVVSWSGSIVATFDKGQQAKFETYSVTSIFRKTDAGWKIIHDHESGLPAEMIQ